VTPSDEASPAPSNQDRVSELERSNANLRALLEATQAIGRSLRLDDVFEEVIRQAASVFNCESASLLLLDEERGRLVFQVAQGPVSHLLRGRWIDRDQGIAGEVIRTGDPSISNDVDEDENFFPGIDKKTRVRTRSLMAAPLIHRDKTLGVVEVLNPKDRVAFTEPDLLLLRLFTNLGAVAMSNARDFARIEREYRVMHDSWLCHPRIVGKSPALQKTLGEGRVVAKANTSVLIEGPTGTGKELLARLIHEKSPRGDRPFVPVNCAALTETLLESELFGHEEGSFTGATKQHRGRFEMADGGTLFLDEVGEISPTTQPKLLRVLQEREFVRVGGAETITCDVRIIAATNRNLRELIEDGRFREDLYYRLSVFPIKVPSLAERIEDVVDLVDHFIAELAPGLGIARPRVEPDALSALMRYHWPGNIRELRNIVERCMLLCSGDITLESLPAEIAGLTETSPEEPAQASTLAEHERALIVQALKSTGWNQSAAARELGIGRDHLRYRIKKYGIKRPDRD
jgi:Nif-specific regulatory protein